jgi:hypothetical protein
MKSCKTNKMIELEKLINSNYGKIADIIVQKNGKRLS